MCLFLAWPGSPIFSLHVRNMIKEEVTDYMGKLSEALIVTPSPPNIQSPTQPPQRESAKFSRFTVNVLNKFRWPVMKYHHL